MMTKRKQARTILLGAILALGVGAGLVPKGATMVKAESANINFANATQRDSLNTEEQVWISGPITMTIDKHTGINIVDYTNPIRIYAGHKITFSWDFSVSSIESIEITANSATYANDTKDSI